MFQDYYEDRADAGRQLAAALRRDLRARVQDRPLVLALPRGGLPVAEPVADALGLDLDVLVVRKIGTPQNPEFALGAIGQDGARVIDENTTARLGLNPADVDRLIAAESRELQRRVVAYRGDRPPLQVSGRPVIIVDDGLATGSTAAAAVAVARHLGASYVTVAVPVGSREAVDWLRSLADHVVCLDTPPGFRAVGEFYRDFGQVSDDEVVATLARSHAPGQARRAHPGPGTPEALDAEVVVQGPGLALPGHLTLPAGASGVVLFAHGSGSSRHSPRNVHVARTMNHAGLGTLLFDLLSQAEADDRALVFDIPLLADRLVAAIDWTGARPECASLPIGLFGASTGAAAALVAAAHRASVVRAVVSRGGRPDLAEGWLGAVRAPTLLIVGGHDDQVLALNRAAARELRCEQDLVVIPGATHLFEEPGTLDAVADVASAWFSRHFGERSVR